MLRGRRAAVHDQNAAAAAAEKFAGDGQSNNAAAYDQNFGIGLHCERVTYDRPDNSIGQ